MLGSGGLELVPTTGIVEAPARGQGRGRDRDDPPRRARRRPRLRGADRRDVGRPQRARARLAAARSCMHAHGVDDLAFDTAIAAGANGAKPHARAGRPARRAEDARRRRLGRAARRLLLRLHAHARDRRAAGGAAARLRRLPRGAARGRRGDPPGHDRRRGRPPRARRDRGGGLRRQLRPRPRPRRRRRRSTRRRASRPSRPTRSRSGNVITIEPGIYLPGVGGVRIEDLAVVRERRRRAADGVPEGPAHGRLTRSGGHCRG